MKSEDSSGSTNVALSAEAMEPPSSNEEAFTMGIEEANSTTVLSSSTAAAAAAASSSIPTEVAVSEPADDDDNLTYQPSEYELQRLERIRRNQEYLASLGLETLKQPQQKKKRKSAEGERPPVEKRPKSSRLQGKEFNFNIEDLFNMKKILGTVVDKNTTDDISGSCKGPPSEQSPENTNNKSIAVGAAASINNNNNNNNDPSTEKKIKYREFISKELRRMQTERRLNLRASERNMKAAEKELRIAEREYNWVAKRKSREEEAKKKRLQWEELRLSTILSAEYHRLQDERKTVQKVGLKFFLLSVSLLSPDLYVYELIYE
jgi:hypothetical protein